MDDNPLVHPGTPDAPGLQTEEEGSGVQPTRQTKSLPETNPATSLAEGSPASSQSFQGTPEGPISGEITFRQAPLEVSPTPVIPEPEPTPTTPPFPPIPPQETPLPFEWSPKQDDGKKHRAPLIAIIITIIVLLVAAGVILFLFRQRIMPVQKMGGQESSVPAELIPTEVLVSPEAGPTTSATPTSRPVTEPSLALSPAHGISPTKGAPTTVPTVAETSLPSAGSVGQTFGLIVAGIAAAVFGLVLIL